jgi:glyceraldehyde-3-phosphate dehydrogenase/erythrose-4-phosphate dehydrogenase
LARGIWFLPLHHCRVELAAVNELADAAMLAHLFKHDSVLAATDMS